MDYSSLTVEDCIRKLEQEGMAAVIENEIGRAHV